MDNKNLFLTYILGGNMVSNIKVEQAVVVEKKTKEIIKKYAIFFVLIIICTFMSFASPHFFTLTNIINVFLQHISIIAIISVGVSFIIITGGIDLSLGSAMALGGILVAWFTSGTPSWISVIITLLIGMLFGLIIGLLIVKTGINAFITTLAMLNIFRGIALLITGGMPIAFNEHCFFFW